MKLKLKEVLEISRGLEELGQSKSVEDVKISYRLAKLRRDISEELRLFDATRKALVERIGGGKEISANTPEHREFQQEVEKLLGETVEVYWVVVPYGDFNPKNKLKLSEDFLFLTFPMWSDPDSKLAEPPEPEAP